MNSQLLQNPRTVNVSMEPLPQGIGGLVDRASYLFLWVFVFAVPWEEQVPPGVSNGIAVSHWFGLAAACLAVTRILITRRARKLGSLHYWMMAFVLWAAMSLIWSVDPESTAARINTYTQLLLMVWLFWELAASEHRTLGLFYAYICGTIIPCLGTIQNELLGHGSRGSEVRLLNGGDRYSAGHINVNDLGVLLVLSVPMAVYLGTRRRSGPMAYLCWFQLGLAMVTIFLTGSRGSLLALLVALVTVPLCFSTMSKSQRAALLIIGIGIAACGLCFVPNATWDRLSTIGSEISQGTLTHRTSIWAAGLEVFRDHPLLGVGAAAYATSVQSLLDVPYASHNTFLSVLVELGVVGASILVLLLANLFHCAAQLPKLERRFWTVLLLSWAVSVSSLTWEYRKPTWIVFGLLATQYAFSRASRNGLLSPALPFNRIQPSLRSSSASPQYQRDWEIE